MYNRSTQAKYDDEALLYFLKEKKDIYENIKGIDRSQNQKMFQTR